METEHMLYLLQLHYRADERDNLRHYCQQRGVSGYADQVTLKGAWVSASRHGFMLFDAEDGMQKVSFELSRMEKFHIYLWFQLTRSYDLPVISIRVIREHKRPTVNRSLCNVAHGPHFSCGGRGMHRIQGRTPPAGDPGLLETFPCIGDNEDLFTRLGLLLSSLLSN